MDIGNGIISPPARMAGPKNIRNVLYKIYRPHPRFIILSIYSIFKNSIFEVIISKNSNIVKPYIKILKYIF